MKTKFRVKDDVLTMRGIGRLAEFDGDADGTAKVIFSSKSFGSRTAFEWFKVSDLRKVI